MALSKEIGDGKGQNIWEVRDQDIGDGSEKFSLTNECGTNAGFGTKSTSYQWMRIVRLPVYEWPYRASLSPDGLDSGEIKGIWSKTHPGQSMALRTLHSVLALHIARYGTRGCHCIAH